MCWLWFGGIAVLVLFSRSGDTDGSILYYIILYYIPLFTHSLQCDLYIYLYNVKPILKRIQSGSTAVPVLRGIPVLSIPTVYPIHTHRISHSHGYLFHRLRQCSVAKQTKQPISIKIRLRNTRQ